MDPETKLHESSYAYETASKAIASLAPIGNIHMHLCGFHVYAQDHTRHVEAHHFCNHKNKGFYQCVIYDSEARDARLIGIEYVVDENVFKSLPEEEKKYWHSHKYEVESGLLYLDVGVAGYSVIFDLADFIQTKGFVPNVVNDRIEGNIIADFQKTYGKAVHTWAIDKNPDLPLGPPQLMMNVTGQGQLSDQVVQERDKRLGISTESKKELRAGYLPKYEKDEMADQWEKTGTGITFEPKEVQFQVSH